MAEQRSTFAPEIEALDEFDEPINMLVFGDHGAGKTVLSGSDESVLIIAIENGTISAKRMGSKARLVKVKTWGDLDSLRLWIRAELRKAGAYEKGAERQFEYQGRMIRWLAIDTATEMQDLCLRAILDKAHAENPAKRDEDTPAIQDYGKWQNAFKRFVKSFNDLPINVLWLAASMQEENEEGETIVRPAFNGKLGTRDNAAMSKWVCGTVHAYGHLVPRTDKETREQFRRLIFRQPIGKDRYGVLSPYVDRPTIPKLERLITAPPDAAPRRRRRTPASTTESE